MLKKLFILSVVMTSLASPGKADTDVDTGNSDTNSNIYGWLYPCSDDNLNEDLRFESSCNFALHYSKLDDKDFDTNPCNGNIKLCYQLSLFALEYPYFGKNWKRYPSAQNLDILLHYSSFDGLDPKGVCKQNEKVCRAGLSPSTDHENK